MKIERELYNPEALGFEELIEVVNTEVDVPACPIAKPCEAEDILENLPDLTLEEFRKTVNQYDIEIEKIRIKASNAYEEHSKLIQEEMSLLSDKEAFLLKNKNFWSGSE